jgi:hypothetical protein
MPRRTPAARRSPDEGTILRLGRAGRNGMAGITRTAGACAVKPYSVSIYLHLERGRAFAPYASHGCHGVRDTLLRGRQPAASSHKGTLKCLRRILPCAWSPRQRICFLNRRVFRFASSKAIAVRSRAARAFLSRTGSSSFAIRDSGTSGFVDRLTSKLRHRSHPATMRGSEKIPVESTSSLPPAIDECPAKGPVIEAAGGIDVTR